MANEKHLLLTIQGDSNTPDLSSEVWQVGLRLALNFGPIDDIATLPNDWEPVATTINRVESSWTITGNWKAGKSPSFLTFFNPDDYLNDQVAPAVAAWMADNKSSNQMTVRQMALYPIGAPSGRAVPAPPYSSGTPCLLTMTDVSIAGTVSGLLPLQNSIVASHRTSQIGRAGRGRMYLPPTGPSSVSNGRLTSAVVSDVLDAQVALLQALDLDPVLSTDPHVRPIVTGGNWTKYSVINQVRVGDIMDTQQRRRRQLLETVSSAAVTY